MSSGKTDLPVVMSFAVGPLSTNCYFVYDRSSMMGAVIDPGWHDEKMLKKISDSGADVIAVINTHGHADHIAGNTDFTVPAAIHRLDEACLYDPERNLSCFSGSALRLPRAGRIIDDGDILSIGSFDLEVIHTPGHTAGGISLRCGEYIFSGDTLFYEGIGRTDLPGGDLETILSSIRERLLCFPQDYQVFPGHGPGTTIGEAAYFMQREFF